MVKIVKAKSPSDFRTRPITQENFFGAKEIIITSSGGSDAYCTSYKVQSMKGGTYAYVRTTYKQRFEYAGDGKMKMYPRQNVKIEKMPGVKSRLDQILAEINQAISKHDQEVFGGTYITVEIIPKTSKGKVRPPRKEATKADKARLAKLPGKRVSKSGKTYYEYREDRTDDTEEQKTHGVKTVEGLRDKIRPYENKIRSDPKETCFGLDKYGRKAYEKTSGLKSRVYVDDMPANLPIFTHNHPSGAAFSNADIATAVRMNVGELRVCSTVADYYLRPKVAGWNARIKKREAAGRTWANEYEYINQALFVYYNKMASDEYTARLIKAHTFDGTAEANRIWEEVKRDVNRLHSHEAMQKFAKARNLIYQRTLRKGVKLWQPKD